MITRNLTGISFATIGNGFLTGVTYPLLSFIMKVVKQTPMTKTQRLINRIEQKESFYDIAFLCEDFQTFIDEISEWGVDLSLIHI